MNLTELYQAVEDARKTMRQADYVADSLARILVGRLRNVSSYTTLNTLKRELQKYNMHTLQWRD